VDSGAQRGDDRPALRCFVFSTRSICGLFIDVDDLAAANGRIAWNIEVAGRFLAEPPAESPSHPHTILDFSWIGGPANLPALPGSPPRSVALFAAHQLSSLTCRECGPGLKIPPCSPPFFASSAGLALEPVGQLFVADLLQRTTSLRVLPSLVLVLALKLRLTDLDRDDRCPGPLTDCRTPVRFGILVLQAASCPWRNLFTTVVSGRARTPPHGLPPSWGVDGVGERCAPTPNSRRFHCNCDLDLMTGNPCRRNRRWCCGSRSLVRFDVA